MDADTETQPPQRAKRATGPANLETKNSLADAIRRERARVQATPSQIGGIAGAPAAARPEGKELAEQERAAQKKEAARGFSAGAAASRSGTLRDEADKRAAGELAKALPPAEAPGVAEQRTQTGTVTVSSAANYKSSPLAMIASARGWVMWRVGAQGSIERSLNAGRTWQAQASNVDADLVAGSAPSDTVCWLVGRAGTILRTTDGEHWEKIPSPTMLDWTSVKAQDALRAEVSAGRKQIYVTTDGGQTWQGPTK